MKFEIPCGMWIKKDDEKVLLALQAADRWLSAEELSEITGVRVAKVERTLRMLARQMRNAEARREFIEENK
ncbi:MAG: hypothetical protein IKU84_02705 [Clostridia bacterium]|nr:hypothetical protein [Clostridia bacterium]